MSLRKDTHEMKTYYVNPELVSTVENQKASQNNRVLLPHEHEALEDCFKSFLSSGNKSVIEPTPEISSHGILATQSNATKSFVNDKHKNINSISIDKAILSQANYVEAGKEFNAFEQFFQMKTPLYVNADDKNATKTTLEAKLHVNSQFESPTDFLLPSQGPRKLDDVMSLEIKQEMTSNNQITASKLSDRQENFGYDLTNKTVEDEATPKEIINEINCTASDQSNNLMNKTVEDKATAKEIKNVRWYTANEQINVDCSLEKLIKLNFQPDKPNETIWHDHSLSTSQYHKEIDQLFKKVENTICELAPDINKPNKSLLVNESLSNVDWNDDSFVANAIIDMSVREDPDKSFGTVIKKALLENVKKSVGSSATVNKTFVEINPVFKELGSFYGLPDKVKILLQQYKGIEKLYG